MPGSSAVKTLTSAISAGNLAVVGQGAAVAMAMTYVTMADSLGLAMENAIAQQQRMQMISSAALVQVLVLIFKKGATSS